MKIDGIDPLLLNRIKEQTDRMEIQRAERTLTDTRVSREGDSSRRSQTYIPEQQDERSLNNALARLNENAERDGLPLRFRARRENNLWQVEVLDTENNKVIRNIPTDRVHGVVNRLHSLFGLILDEKR